MERVFESMSYVQLAMVVCGQLVMGLNTVLASTLFFLGNCIAVSRCFVLCRPMSDKIKDICLLLISIVSFVLSII